MDGPKPQKVDGSRMWTVQNPKVDGPSDETWSVQNAKSGPNPKVGGPKGRKVDGLKRQIMNGSIDRKWTVLEDKYISLLVKNQNELGWAK